MALTTENKKLAQDIYNIYSKAEAELLEKIKLHVGGGLKTDKSTLKEVSALRVEAQKIVKKAERESKKKAREELIKDYERGKISAEQDFRLPKQMIQNTNISYSLQRYLLEIDGIIDKSNVRILRETEDIYRAIQAEISTGLVAEYEQRKVTAQKMLNRFADEGITGFIDKAGRRWDMTSYVEMATRSISANASLQGQIDRQTENGRDLVVVSDHAGECPVCRPWENKVLSISGNSLKYPALSKARSAGLFHPNCRHVITGYIEGLTDLTPPANGGTPEQYAYTQKQRYNERQLRAWKRRDAVALDDKAKLKAKQKIREYNKKQTELLKEYESKFGMTLSRKRNRENLTSIR